MQTTSGQAVSGAQGAGNEAGSLLAERTGNTASLPGIIDTNARSAMAANSGNALDIANQNANLKLKQQQAGASGLESLYGTDTSNALKSLGLSNEAIGQWVNADNSTGQQDQNIFNDSARVLGIPAPPSSSQSGGANG